jgi:hypothetical protein
VENPLAAFSPYGSFDSRLGLCKMLAWRVKVAYMGGFSLRRGLLPTPDHFRPAALLSINQT